MTKLCLNNNNSLPFHDVTVSPAGKKEVFFFARILLPLFCRAESKTKRK